MTLPPADLDALEKMERDRPKWSDDGNGALYAGREQIAQFCDDEGIGLADSAAFAVAVRNALPDLLRMARRCVDLERKIIKSDGEIDQILGQAIGHYPWYKDDQRNFPGATEADGVCTGEHVPHSLAAEAAGLIASLRRRCVEMEAALRQAIDLISIPASRHHDGRDHITGSPRYSAGLLKHHAECAALLPVLKAALGERP